MEKNLYTVGFLKKMYFDKDTTNVKIGEKVGYLFSYFLFTTILWFILQLLDRLGSWNYFHIMVVTVVVALTGYLIKRWLTS